MMSLCLLAWWFMARCFPCDRILPCALIPLVDSGRQPHPTIGCGFKRGSPSSSKGCVALSHFWRTAEDRKREKRRKGGSLTAFEILNPCLLQVTPFPLFFSSFLVHLRRVSFLTALGLLLLTQAFLSLSYPLRSHEFFQG